MFYFCLRFPWKNPALLKQWIVAIKRNEWHPSRHSKLCSAHFKASDYLDRPGTERKYLKEGVVPRVFSFTQAKPERRLVVRHQSAPSTSDCIQLDQSIPSTSDDIEMLSVELTLQEPQSVTPSTPKKTKKSTNSPVTPTKQKYRRKIKILQQRLKRRDTRIRSLKNLIASLKKKGGNDNLVHAIEHNFDEDFFKILQSQFLNKGKKTGKRYDERTKSFAMTLQFYSPKAYKFVRGIFRSLPHPATIRKWVSVLDCEPGFIAEVFEFLKLNPGCKKYSLVLDSMSIRKQVIWDKKNNKFSGYVDLGNGFSDQNETYASEALVFMVVSMKEKFKCPVGYFLVDKICAEVQAELVKTCILKLHEVGIDVVNLTFDGAQANIRTARLLGCNFECKETSFEVNGKRVSVSLDACHMVKLARNTLADKKVISSPLGDIKWQYIVDLVEEQKKIGLKFGNKLSSHHVRFFNKKMNVSLAVQTLSASTANAIEFLMNSGHPKFEGAEATIEFIRNIDKLFDALNSRNPFEKGLKQPLFPEKKEIWEELFKESIDYLESLSIGGKNILNHQRKMFAVGFIISCKSIINISQKLLDDGWKYVLTYKLSQDHLELFFSCMRAKGGWNNNPNSMQFKWAMRRLLFRNAVQVESGNCKLIDSPDLQPSVFESEEAELLKIDEIAIKMANLESKNLKDFKENILVYVSGFIVRNLIKMLTCKYCIKMILHVKTVDKVLIEHNYCINVEKNYEFTKFVDLGGLKLPSPSVLGIIKKCETFFQAYSGVNIQMTNAIQKAISFVNNQYRDSGELPFPGSHPLLNEIMCEELHETQVVKQIVSSYIQLRLYHHGKTLTATDILKENTSVRQKMNKLVLFQNV